MNDQKRRLVLRGTAPRPQGESTDGLAESLGSVLDLLNQRLHEVERRLERFGVAGYVRLPEDDDPEGPMVGTLSFEKHGNQWRLFRVQEDLFREVRVKQEPLLSAPRWVRLAAVSVLPELVAAVKANAAREAAVLQEALKSVDAVLRMLPDPLVDDDNDCPF